MTLSYVLDIVESRTTSSPSNTQCWCFAFFPIMSNRIRAVSLAMLSIGCFKVVNDGITYFPISTPSKPVREISSGTLYPASDNAFHAPIASISEVAKIAVH